MSITVPPAKNYGGSKASFPTGLERTPTEGNRFMPIRITWGDDGGANNCVSINATNDKGYQTVSQICAISIDNSLNGSDVQFIFPDSQQTYTVPAYFPATVFPVITGQTQFFVSCPNAQATDITNFAILNFYPYPSSIPTTTEQNTSTFNDIAVDPGATDQLIATGTNGTIEAIYVSISLDGQSNNYSSCQLVDGNGTVLAGWTVADVLNDRRNFNALQMSSCALRFIDGLTLVQGSDVLTGIYSINILYRQP